MSLKQQLMEDMKNAMRARDAVTLGTIRFLLSTIKNVEIDAGEQSEAQLQDIVRKQIKQMKDAISDYERGGRTDLVVEENAKVAILQTYLPQQMSDEALAALVDAVIAENPEAAFGQVISLVRARTAGTAEGGAIATLVKAKLLQ